MSNHGRYSSDRQNRRFGRALTTSDWSNFESHPRSPANSRDVDRSWDFPMHCASPNSSSALLHLYSISPLPRMFPDHVRFNPRSPFEKGQGTRAGDISSTHRSRRKVYCLSAQNRCVRSLHLFHRIICTSSTPISSVSHPFIAF